ncbi:MAG: HAD family hydrolase [Gammaproteobacteria bacterium]|jgi:phosphoglycolate phosphatase
MTRATTRTVLFDLDGTLLDTAPDLAWALNEVRRVHGDPPLDYAVIRAIVSHGSLAMTRIACPHTEGSDPFEAFRGQLLDTYRNNLAIRTQLFAGMAELLDEFDDLGICWGIVTNKPAWLTNPLLEQMQLRKRAATIVSGDTLTQSKPHPAPLLLAAEQTASVPGDCLYVGDAERDVIAGNAAGMHTMVALYGYLDANDRPESWGADVLAESPAAIREWLQRESPGTGQ